MNDIYKNFHTDTIQGFEVRLRFIDEDMHPSDLFDENEEYGKEALQAIYNSDMTWLCAIVGVFKCGVELGYSSLGAITYDWHDLKNFIKDEFYNMAHEAIEEAKLKLEELKAN